MERNVHNTSKSHCVVALNPQGFEPVPCWMAHAERSTTRKAKEVQKNFFRAFADYGVELRIQTKMCQFRLVVLGWKRQLADE